MNATIKISKAAAAPFRASRSRNTWNTGESMKGILGFYLYLNPKGIRHFYNLRVHVTRRQFRTRNITSFGRN